LRRLKHWHNTHRRLRSDGGGLCRSKSCKVVLLAGVRRKLEDILQHVRCKLRHCRCRRLAIAAATTSRRHRARKQRRGRRGLFSQLGELADDGFHHVGARFALRTWYDPGRRWRERDDTRHPQDVITMGEVCVACDRRPYLSEKVRREEAA